MYYICSKNTIIFFAFTELEKRETPLIKFDTMDCQTTLSHMMVNPGCTAAFMSRDGTALALQEAIEQASSKADTADMFISAVRRYTRAKKFTPRMFNELVEKIESTKPRR